MFVISFSICLFIYFSVKYAIQSNDCDVFVNKQSIYLSIYLSIYPSLSSLYTLQLILFSSTEDLLKTELVEISLGN